MESRLPISAVICAKNSGPLMEECLRAVKDQNVDEIIIVDGLSTDDTVAIARKYTSNIISDEGKGIAVAHRLGIEASRNSLIAMVSPDNILDPGCLEQLITDMEKNNWVGVQAIQRSLLDEHSTYWDRGWGYMLEIVVVSGPSRIIGNSSLYRKDSLLKYPFDETFKMGDDIDICERWRADGLFVGVGTSVCYERQTMNFAGFKNRWKWYGTGDARFIVKWRDLDPKIARRHFFHPLRNYIIGKSWRALSDGRFAAIPYFVLAGIYRYEGMLRGLYKLSRANKLAQNSKANPSPTLAATSGVEGSYGRDV